MNVASVIAPACASAINSKAACSEIADDASLKGISLLLLWVAHFVSPLHLSGKRLYQYWYFAPTDDGV